MAKTPRVYLDACVILAWLTAENEQAEVVQGLLDNASAGRVEVFTSSISVAEVAYGPDPVDAELMDALWVPPSPIRLMSASIPTARRAAEFVRQARADDWGLRSMDAMHLSSAVEVNADRLLTYENESKRKRWAAVAGIAVEEPTTEGSLF